ncbi:MAG: hypothetical protein U1F05_02335 [Burkholderiales bacterium]
MLTALTVVALIVVVAMLMYFAPDLIGWLLAITCGVAALLLLTPVIVALLLPFSLLAIFIFVALVFALAIGAALLWPLLFVS